MSNEEILLQRANFWSNLCVFAHIITLEQDTPVY